MMEIELKLLIDAQDVEKLENLPALEAVTLGTRMAQQQKDVYYDTPDLDLRRAGAGLRMRRVNGHHVQTLKAGGGVSAGLHQREEWETDVDGDKPDLAALRELIGDASPHAALLAAPGLSERLEPVFTLDVTRALRNLRLPSGDEIEMALDRGVIRHDHREDAVCEVELELKSGAAAHLYRFALQLLEAIPLRIGMLSKAERGYAMRLPPQWELVKASRPRLDPFMSVEQAFEAIVANCMRQVQANEQAALRGTNPESVHQMRVGLRRLRSALGIFSGTIDCPTVIQGELKWLASELGAARDWDVLAGSTLELVGGIAPDDAGIGRLRQGALEQARKNREEAARAIDSPRHARLVLQFAEWMASRHWRDAASKQRAARLDQPLKKFAKKALAHADDRLRKRGKQLHQDSPERRHRARIAAKKARYASEFFASLYPRGRVKEYVSRLSDLQRELGWLNDAAVATEQLRELQHADGDTASAAAFAHGYLFACVYADNPALARKWKKFRKARAPCKVYKD